MREQQRSLSTFTKLGNVIYPRDTLQSIVAMRLQPHHRNRHRRLRTTPLSTSIPGASHGVLFLCFMFPVSCCLIPFRPVLIFVPFHSIPCVPIRFYSVSFRTDPFSFRSISVRSLSVPLRSVLFCPVPSRPDPFCIPFPAADSVAQAVARFDSLCKLILKFPDLASSAKFVFVPGPQDPGAGDTLPRPPVRKKKKTCLLLDMYLS